MAFISGFSALQLYFSDPLMYCETPEMVPFAIEQIHIQIQIVLK